MPENGMKQMKIDHKKSHDSRSYEKTKMQRELILQKLKSRGCRVTKQRMLILDIILENDCSCCKEIYATAAGIDSSIGAATVYRFVNTLEEIGAISRKNMYRIVYSDTTAADKECIVVLDDDTTYDLSSQKWREVVKAGLSTCGYLKSQNVASIIVTK